MVATEKKMVVRCSHCNQKMEISAKDLRRTGSSNPLFRKEFEFNCKQCGARNVIVSREVLVHILREMNEL